MRTKNTTRAVLLALLTMIVAACGSAVTADEPTTTAAVQREETTTTVEPLALPDPDYAWDFDGDGKASAGGLDVEFLGAYESSANAASFDGHTGHGITTAPGPLDTTVSFTVSAWVTYAAKSEIAAAVSQLGDVTGIFQLGIGEHSQWWFMMKTEDLTGLDHAVWAESSETLPANRWTHIVGVSDQEAGVIRLYVDGRKQGETPFDAPLSAEGPMTIGRSQFDSSPGNFWPGGIDSVAVYQSALTDDQVAALHDGTRPTSLPPRMPAPDPSTYANGILNGTWDALLDEETAQLTSDEFLAEGLIDRPAEEVRVRIGFDDHEWWLGLVFDGELALEPGGVPAGDGGTFLIEGDVLVLTNYWSDAVYTWTLDGDEMTLDLVEFCDNEGSEPVCGDDPGTREVTEHTYTKSSDDPSY